MNRKKKDEKITHTSNSERGDGKQTNDSYSNKIIKMMVMIITLLCIFWASYTFLLEKSSKNSSVKVSASFLFNQMSSFFIFL